MDDLPPEPQNLKFLRRLVTVLTATMIAGIATIVVLMFIRLTAETPAQTAPDLPDRITLPDGQTATAVTAGAGWYAVVTDKQEILVFDRATGELRQRVRIDTD
jgi:hypothetical protein